MGVRAATTLVRDRVLARRPRLRPRSRLATRLVALLAVLGPGLIAANAGNDAGGIATYASVGAKHGYDLLWMMVVITVSLIVVQEMAARMGAVTGKGLAELIREQYGVRWALFSTVSVLLANLGICISEFVGIGAALNLAGVPFQVSVPIAALVVWLLVVRGSYKVAERVFVLMTIPFFAYPIAAILAHPHWGSVGKAIVAPHIQLNSAYLFLFIATAATTITPFMQLYVQSAVVEKGLGPEDLKAERAEVISGSIFANVIAMFIIIATGATLFVHGDHTVNNAADAARALKPFAGRFAEALFAVGLLGRQPARSGDPARDRRLCDRRDVRLREGHLAPPTAGARVRRRDHDADRDRHDGRDHSRRPGDQAARRRSGRERRAAADHALLRLALGVQPRVDGRIRERTHVQPARRCDRAGNIDPLASSARRHVLRIVVARADSP